jgi:hypothetical protein
LKIINKGNRKTTFIFWNFENQKEWKNRGEQKKYLGKKNLLTFRK